MILGGSQLQLDAIKKSISMGNKTVVCDMDPDAIGFNEIGAIKEVISTLDKESVLMAAKKHNIDGIITVASDQPINTVAYVGEALGLNAISIDSAKMATNKFLMREQLSKTITAIPEYYFCASFEEFKKSVQALLNKYGKCIVKPVDSSGSRGVELVDRTNSNNLQNIYNYVKNESRTGALIIEGFMEGNEISVETFSENGKVNFIQITDKITTGPPHFVEMGHIQPANLTTDDISKIKSLVIDALKALNINFGPSHTEIMMTKNGPKIIEIGARLGGDYITSDLVPLSTGVDLTKAVIDGALDREVDLTVKKQDASAVLFFKSKKGIINNIVGISILEKMSEVQSFKFYYKNGDYVTDTTSSSSRLGHIIFKGKSYDEMLELMNRIRNLIKIDIKE
ncbi:ATP-grasp domain-containing protein [Facklamia hominis]|uniref:ATP-grasp domain-containing protein n=1 Tax=Facklamia hominis TaxID=178214 RepID=UPI0038FCF0C4